MSVAGAEPSQAPRRVQRVAMLFLFLPPEFAGGGLQGLRLMEQVASRGLEVTALTGLARGVAAPREEPGHGGRLRRFAVPTGARGRYLALSIQAAWLAKIRSPSSTSSGVAVKMIVICVFPLCDIGCPP